MIRHLALAFVAIAAPVEAAQRSFTISSFDRIRVEGPYMVTLAAGRSPFARAEGLPVQLDAIDLRVEGRTLILRQRSGIVPPGTGGRVTVSLGTPDLRSAQLSGSGRLDIDRMKGLTLDIFAQGSGTLSVGDIQADRVNAGHAGSGELKLNGRAKVVRLSAQGTPTVLALNLRAAEVTIAADGAAKVLAYPEQRVSITAAGTASIELSGSATCTLRLSGAVSVSGCGKD